MMLREYQNHHFSYLNLPSHSHIYTFHYFITYVSKILLSKPYVGTTVVTVLLFTVTSSLREKGEGYE